MKWRKKAELAERRKASAALGFGTSFAAGMAVFSLAGHWLDGKYDREPLFTLLGIFLGFGYGGWELWKLVVTANQHIAEQDRLKALEEEGRVDEASV